MPNNPSDRAEWHTLKTHADSCRSRSIASLFDNDPERAKGFSRTIGGLFIDFSKQNISDETLSLLLALAEACDVEGWRDKMMSGEKINTTENRAVLHTALRAPESETVLVDGENIVPKIHAALSDMQDFTQAVRNGQKTGTNGRPFETVVHIGIGGSDLGPRMVCAALKGRQDSGPEVRFVSNIDGYDIAAALNDLDAETPCSPSRPKPSRRRKPWPTP